MNLSQDFIGTIDTYNSELKLYKVYYADDDIEDLCMKELKVFIKKRTINMTLKEKPA